MATTPPAQRKPKKKPTRCAPARTSTTRTSPRCESSSPNAARSGRAGSPGSQFKSNVRFIAIKNAREVALLPYASTAR